MRYADGGGLTAEGRARREDVRLLAARLFEQDMDAWRVGEILGVNSKSVFQVGGGLGGGGETVLSWGGGGWDCWLVEEQQAAGAHAAIDSGPAVAGWEIVRVDGG